jgi:hypothetical protein
MSEHRVLVCGGRYFRDKWSVYDCLDAMSPSPALIIEGGALGADYIARGWAIDRGVDYLTFVADWHGLGRAAGPLRNQQMLDEGKPDLVVAFPGGSGTADMVRRAKAAGVRVIEVPVLPPSDWTEHLRCEA